MYIFEVKIRDKEGNEVKATRRGGGTTFEYDGNLHPDEDIMSEAIDKLQEAVDDKG